jgi:hypothetical protein
MSTMPNPPQLPQDDDERPESKPGQDEGTNRTQHQPNPRAEPRESEEFKPRGPYPTGNW